MVRPRLPRLPPGAPRAPGRGVRRRSRKSARTSEHLRLRCLFLPRTATRSAARRRDGVGRRHGPRRGGGGPHNSPRGGRATPETRNAPDAKGGTGRGTPRVNPQSRHPPAAPKVLVSSWRTGRTNPSCARTPSCHTSWHGCPERAAFLDTLAEPYPWNLWWLNMRKF